MPLDCQPIRCHLNSLTRLPMWNHLPVNQIPPYGQSDVTWILSLECQCEITWLSIKYHLTVHPIPLDGQSDVTWISSLECQCETTWLSIQYHLTVNQIPLHCRSNTTWRPIRCHFNFITRRPMWNHLTVIVNPIPLDCQSNTTWLSIQYRLTANQMSLDFHH